MESAFSVIFFEAGRKEETINKDSSMIDCGPLKSTRVTFEDRNPQGETNGGKETVYGFLDYDGGTYVSQIQSESLRGALQTWLLEQGLHIEGVSTMQVDISENDLRNLSFDALKGMYGVWCTSVTVGRKLALFHFVLSESVPPQN